jgi:hypothetical protein
MVLAVAKAGKANQSAAPQSKLQRRDEVDFIGIASSIGKVQATQRSPKRQTNLNVVCDTASMPSSLAQTAKRQNTCSKKGKARKKPFP